MISIYLHSLSVFLIVVVSVNSFSLDSNFPIIYEDPQINSDKRSSYFGYSTLAYSRDNYTWVQIGAPRATDETHPDIKEPGLVYRCEFSGHCRPYKFDSTGNQKSKEYHEMKDGAWHGATMVLHPTENLIAVCSPRWINKLEIELAWKVLGACYVRHANDDIYNGTTLNKIIPLLEEQYMYYKHVYKVRGYEAYSTFFYNYLGQAGMSAYFPKDSGPEGIQLVLGAPGILNWRGSTVLLDIKEGDPKKQLQIKKGIVPLTFKTNRDADYLGYSVVAGRFFPSRERLFVAGVPRADKYRGKVVVYKFNGHYKAPIIIQQLTRDEYGGYFGAAMEVADITSDTLDDLLVSAPMLLVPTVFIYIGSTTDSLRPSLGLKELRAPSSFGRNSRFGSAIAAVDLDVDGHKEVLVGAPYANDGVGAVAIWAGSAKGPQGNVLPTMILTPREFHNGIRGFGISIAPPVDLDNNNYPDVVVGAHISGHTVVFRGRPVAKILINLERYNFDQLLRETKNFTLKLCYSYSSMFELSALNFELNISVDTSLRRAFFNGNKNTRNEILIQDSLQPKKEKCHILTVRMEENILNFLEPLRISATVAIIDNTKLIMPIIISKNNIAGEDYFDKHYPTANEVETSLEIPFATGCGADEICSVDLSVQLSTEDNRETFVLGLTTIHKLKITVENKGEHAYMTQVKITLPPLTSLDRISSYCSIIDTNILCNVDNPMRGNTTMSHWIEIDMSDVTDNKRSGDVLEFKAEVMTRSKEINPINNIAIYKLPLRFEASIDIIGKSLQDIYHYKQTEEVVSKEFVIFEQFFQLQKSGISEVDEVLLSVSIPYAYTNQSGNYTFMQIYRPEGQLNGQTFYCKDTDFIYYDGKKQPFNNDTKTPKATRLEKATNLVSTIITRSNGMAPIDRSDIKNKNNTIESQLIANRTTKVACGKDFLCHEVKCIIGPFKTRAARLQLKMALNVSTLKDVSMGSKDIILLNIQGKANILGVKDQTNLESSYIIETVFISSPQNTKVALWLIIFSVFLGILLLMLVIGGLIKVGFFKRKKRDDLQAIKNDKNKEADFTEEDFEDYPIDDAPLEDLPQEDLKKPPK